MKKLGVLCMVFVMLFAVVGCSGGQNKTASELEKAQKAAEGYLHAIIKFDSDEMKKYMTEAEAAELGDEDISEDMFAIDDDVNFLADIVKNITYKFKSGEVKPEDTEAKLTYVITRADIDAVVKELNDQAMKAGDDAMPSIDVSKIVTKPIEITVDLIKEKDEWKVNHADDLTMEVWGMYDFLEALFALGGEAEGEGE